jgi:hypothetical protein
MTQNDCADCFADDAGLSYIAWWLVGGAKFKSSKTQVKLTEPESSKTELKSAPEFTDATALSTAIRP